MAKTKSAKASGGGRAPKKEFSYPPPRSASDEHVWVVRDPGATYSHWTSVIGNVTGKFPKGEEASFLGVRKVVRKGIDRRAFERIRDAAGLTTEQLSSVAGIPTRTLARRRERFTPDESERLLRVASVVQKGIEVFGSMDSARKWMAESRRALGGLTPLECCDTASGAAEVENLLGRIAHGVFS